MSSTIIPSAYAATTTATTTVANHQAAAGNLYSILLLVGFVLIFYFLLWRPQSKRAKEHRDLVSSLNTDDEVLTSGGIVGKITKISDDFVVLAIANGVEITIQKSAIGATLPKGTMNSL
jgi:preprotein translocase subunit YajC